MQFETKEDIDAPIAFVWEQVTDFAAFERRALRRGADVQRRDSRNRPGVGSSWDIRFMYRGRERKLRAEVTEFDMPNTYTVKTRANGIDGVTVIDLVALSRGRTRMSMTIEMSAQSLASRLMLQSLKLAKSRMNRKFVARINAMSVELQERYRRSQPGA